MTSHQDRVDSALGRINSEHGPNLERLAADAFTLYDVPTVCRECGAEFIGKAFKPADGEQRFGWCETCQAIQDAPKLPPKKPDLDLRPPRRVFGEDND